MPTLILSPRHTEDSQTLWRAAIAKGWDVERLPSWTVSDVLLSAPEPVLYIEALMAPHVASQFGLTLVEPPEDWLPRLPAEYRRREVRLSNLGLERSNVDPAFIKPPNDKSFPAGVYTGEQLPREFDDGTAVLVAEVVAWESEFRVFIADNRVRALSIYLRDGLLQRDAGFDSSITEAAEARAFAEAVLGDRRVEIPRAVVMDIGVVRGRGWAVVELNAAWGSGLYGCDPASVLDVLRSAAEPTGIDPAA